MARELEASGALPAASPGWPGALDLRAVGAWSPRSWAMRAILAAAALAVLLGASRALQAAGLNAPYLVATLSGGRIALGFAAAAVVGSAVASPAWRRPLLVAVSAAAFSYFLGFEVLLVGAYALLVCVLARTPVRLRWQIVVALSAWAAVPACRWWVPALRVDGPLAFYMVWVQLAYSGIFVLVEHARAREKPPFVSSLFYLTALPRVLHPFYQPIPPSHVERSARARIDVRTLASGVALGLYGMLLQAVMAFLYRWTSAPHPLHVEVLASILWEYCACAQNIFVAVSLFRLMGFEVNSGMRRPFASESFADWFTRWNTYVREAVLSLFYLPLFLRLRRWLPPRTAVIPAGYAAILVGAYLLNDLLVPLGMAADWQPALARELSPVKLFVLLSLWSAIVLPSALSVGSAPRRTRLPRWTRVGRFWLMYFGLVLATRAGARFFEMLR